MTTASKHQPIYGEPQQPYPEQYSKGVWLFNNRFFFECHEILEELWLESIATPKIFYQMIIHAAVSFVHWENENRRGVISLEHTFKQKADKVGADQYMGFDIQKLRVDMDQIINPLRLDLEMTLVPFEEQKTPTIKITGFEPMEVSEEEILRLGRHE